MDVLCDEEKIVGVLRYNLFWQSVPFLDLLFIDEAYRGQGWGSKMMANWEETMKRMDHVCIARFEDMALAAEIMVTSFRAAFDCSSPVLSA